jgi:hypothetical protein
MTVVTPRCVGLVWLGIVLLSGLSVMGQEEGAEPDHRRILGRWDLTVQGPDGPYPSWLEIRKSGYRTLVGSYVGQFGSARPVAEVKFDGTNLRFVVPLQWEPSRATTWSPMRHLLISSHADHDVNLSQWLPNFEPTEIANKNPTIQPGNAPTIIVTTNANSLCTRQ